MEKLFHPSHRDEEWLLGRFESFLSKKVEIDAVAREEVTRHAPAKNPRIVHRELGRGSTDSLVLLYEEDEVAERYATLVCEPEIGRANASAATKLCLQRGTVGEVLRTVSALRDEDPELWLKVLQLAECFHLTYLCREEYEKNCRKENAWLLGHVAELTKRICMNRSDFDTALANAGSQLETLLQRATALSMTRQRQKDVGKHKVKVWHSKRMRIGRVYGTDLPLAVGYSKVKNENVGKVRIERILTT